MVKDQNNLQWHGKYAEYYGIVLMFKCDFVIWALKLIASSIKWRAVKRKWQKITAKNDSETEIYNDVILLIMIKWLRWSDNN